MKKVMVGILILIPIIILLIVAAVSNIVTVKAWIAVEDIQINYKDTDTEVERLTMVFEDVGNKVVNFKDYVDVVIMPEKANMYTIEWTLLDVECTDRDYQSAYEDYLANKHLNEDNNPDNDISIVYPAAALVAGDGTIAESNGSGDLLISSYCTFTVRVHAEVSATFRVSVEGYDVKSIALLDAKGKNSSVLRVGNSIRLEPNYTPIDSIVDDTQWVSENEAVATVDANGIVTAKSTGTATVYMRAAKYSDGTLVTSSKYTINVEAAASSKYGDVLVTSKKRLTFDELGIVDCTNCEGGDVDHAAKAVTISGDSATLETSNGPLYITICNENDITIENAALYAFAQDGDFVLEVSALPLMLKAVWSDMTKEGVPDGVVFTSSSSAIATVDNSGKVSPKASGMVTITVERESRSFRLQLNVQQKLTTINLNTSDDKLAVGIANESVFASERYVDINSVTPSAKEANSVNIVVMGEPTDKSTQSLREFYRAYKFEIIENADYAHFDSDMPNVLIFNVDKFKEDAQAGNGEIKDIVVKVSARYTRYSDSSFTTETVTIKAIYGVEVNSMKEFRQAANDQKAIAKAVGNIQPSEVVWEFTDLNGHKYRVENAAYSRYTYAISLMQDIRLEDGIDVTPEATNYPYIYGNLYGNGHRMSAKVGQIHTRAYLFLVSWSNVTVSNLWMRTNEINSDTLTTDETSELDGGNAAVWHDENWDRYRIKNARFEYSIFENGLRAVRIQNADVTFDGCITRNMSSAAYYLPGEMRQADIDGIHYYMPKFTHLNVNNCIYSNVLSSVASIAYERFTVQPEKNGDSLRGWFYENDLEKNSAYFKEHFVPDGINLEFKQTGFMDVYNWQNVDKAGLIDVGDVTEEIDNLIKDLSGSLIRLNKAFDGFRYEVPNEAGTTDSYLHLGFVCLGMSMGQGIMDEPTFLKFEHEDPRFQKIYARDIRPSTNDLIEKAGANVIRKFEINFYCYTAEAGRQSGIVPGVTPTLNPNTYARLRGEL